MTMDTSYRHNVNDCRRDFVPVELGGFLMIILEQDDAELRKVITRFQETAGDKLYFQKLLNPLFQSPDWDHSRVIFDMKDDFVGNLMYRTLHGGIIASMLDTAGGHAVVLSIFEKMKGQPMEKQFKKVIRVGSIDFRIDFLRPGKGIRFTADGWILRIGNKVAVTRMELRNEEDILIALGTGTYTVG